MESAKPKTAKWNVLPCPIQPRTTVSRVSQFLPVALSLCTFQFTLVTFYSCDPTVAAGSSGLSHPAGRGGKVRPGRRRSCTAGPSPGRRRPRSRSSDFRRGSVEELAFGADDLDLPHPVMGDVEVPVGIEGDPVGLIVDLARALLRAGRSSTRYSPSFPGSSTGNTRIRFRLLSPTSNSLPPGRITIPLGKARPLATV